MGTFKEKQEYDLWLSEKAAIKRLSPDAKEGAEAKRKRIAMLLKPGNELKFFHYYFNNLIDCEFAYFHKRDVRKIVNSLDIMAALEYPREHAKSIIYGVMVPMLLKARKQLTGMILGSKSNDKATGLLADLQAELMFNKRYIADFGEQYNQGSWKDGHFITFDGIPFWAFGRDQTPRGVRESEKRPNYGLIDDIDDKKLVKNQERVKETVEWVLEDFYGAMSIKGSRLVIVGNRIHSHSVMAHLVGDVEEGDPIRNDLYHSRVYALENPRTHKKDIDNGVPAWKRYTRQQLMRKFNRMGWISALREYFHEHIIEGTYFKKDDFPWVECLPLKEYDALITYNDPSYKNNQTSDNKAIFLIGKTGRYYDIIDCYNRQCSTPDMVTAHYAIASQVPAGVPCKHYMEANFIQDLMLEEYYRQGEKNPPMLRIRGDKRKKPDKEVRIENLTPLTQPGFIRLNIAHKGKKDFKTTLEQFVGFPAKSIKDDGPDGIEGGIFLLDKKKGRRAGGSGKIKTGSMSNRSGSSGRRA